jgi:hypothetical protein
VVIVSDGFENDPPNAAAELVRQYRRMPGGDRTSIIHLNPVFDADRYAPRPLGAPVPTVGLRDAEDLLTMLGFARFAEGRAPLTELEEYLARRTERLLGWYARRRGRATGMPLVGRAGVGEESHGGEDGAGDTPDGSAGALDAAEGTQGARERR